MLRILLFLGTNIAIMLVLSISMRLLGVDTMLAQQGGGLNLTSLIIFCGILVWEVRLSLFPYPNGWQNVPWAFK